MADQLPGFTGDNAGDANTFLQQLFVNRRASPFGTSYKSMHEVGFNKRELAATNQPPADGHPTRMEFKVSSTLGHLVQQLYFRARVVITPKSDAELHAYFDGKADDLDGANRPLTKCLENLKMHPDGLLGMIDNVEMRHNSIVFQRLRRENMRLLRREQYNKEDHELQTRLVNGGMPKYHRLIPRNAGGNVAPRMGNADTWFGALTDFQLESKTHDHYAHYPNGQMWNRTGTNVRGYPGLNNNTTGNALVSRDDPLEHPQYVFPKTQWAQLRTRLPDEPPHLIWENYKPEFCHEIGFKDLPSEVLTRNVDATDNAGYNLAVALGKIRDLGGWVFDQWFEVPHPWHYNTSDAFPILNLVNDMDILFHLRPWQQWIQNWDMVGKFVDIKIEPAHCDMLINYYDIPKQIWDDQFPLNRQMNHYAPDYQEHQEEFTIEVDAPQASDDINASYTSHRISGKDHTININTIDRDARYGMLRLQGAEATRNSTFALDFMSWDILKSCWLEVANEKLLTKIETDVDKTKKYIERFSHFKESKNFVPGEITYFPLGLDCDVHNPGGGVVNIRPFYNNFKLKMQFDPVKIHNLYISQLDHASGGVEANSDVDGTSGSNDKVSQYTNGVQSYKGFITKVGSKYRLKLRATVTFLVLDLVTYQQGQLYKQA